MDFVEAAVVAGGEYQHHRVAAVAGRREAGRFGADILQRLGYERIEGDLGDQRACGRVAGEGGRAGPQLKGPVASREAGRGIGQQFGIKADLVTVEAVGVGGTDPDVAGTKAGGGPEKLGCLHRARAWQ